MSWSYSELGIKRPPGYRDSWSVSKGMLIDRIVELQYREKELLARIGMLEEKLALQVEEDSETIPSAGGPDGEAPDS